MVRRRVVRKESVIALVFIFLFLFSPPPKTKAQYPTIRSNDKLVPAIWLSSNKAEICTPNIGNTGSSTDFISLDLKQRFVQSGLIKKVKFFLANKQKLSGFYITIWRRNEDGTYNLVDETNNLLSDVSDRQVSFLSLKIPLHVHEDDYYGYRLISHGTDSNKFLCGSYKDTYYAKTYIANLPIAQTQFDWKDQSSDTFRVPFEFYIQSPQVVLIGDSLIQGHIPAVPYEGIVDHTNKTTSVGREFCLIVMYSCQNRGIGGTSTDQIVSSFLANVNDLKPHLVILNGGLNDLLGDISTNFFLKNWTIMLDNAKKNKIAVIALLILPSNNLSIDTWRKRDEFNYDLKKLVLSYDNAMFVDASTAIGKTIPKGPKDNIWGIQDDLTVDGTHLYDEGYKRVAKVIAGAIAISPTPHITSSSVSIAKTSVKINWSTNKDSYARIDYGKDITYNLGTIPDTKIVLQKNHSVMLSALRPCNVYHYRIRSGGNIFSESITRDRQFITSGCNFFQKLLMQM